jgi:RNA polymerase sigma-70 factor (ECF subfamily)
VEKVVRLPLSYDDAEKEPISLTDQDDDTLMLMTRSGEGRAFDALVRRYQRMALGIAGKYLGDPLLAEDVAQNSFIDLFRHAHLYRPEGKLRGFLTKIVINNCRMAKRRVKSEANTHQAFVAQMTVDSHESPKAHHLEQRRLLDRAVSSLSPKLREVVVLRYAAGLSYREISEVLGIRLGTVKSRIFAAIAKLSRSLEAFEK